MRIWRGDKRKVSDGTTPFYILVEKVPSDFQLVVELLDASAVTQTCTSIRAGIWNNGRFLPGPSHDTVVSGEIYYADVLMRLWPHEQVAFEFRDTTDGDELRGWAYGVLVKKGESYSDKDHWTGR